MIVKVQLPLNGPGPALIYDETRRVCVEIDIPEDIGQRVMANGGKAYFRAVLNARKQLVFGIQVAEQSW